MTQAKPFTIRPATPEDNLRISELVVEGFVDKFRPVFGDRREISVSIMEKWIELEHAAGGVDSLVAEADGDIVAGVGLRMKDSEDEVVARGLWRTLRQNLGLPRTLWATTLLSHPRYTSLKSEVYVERLVVTPEYQNLGIARGLLDSSERIARGAEKKTVGLHVSGNNEAAINLYEAERYAEISRQKSFLTSYFLGIRDWIYMKKEL